MRIIFHRNFRKKYKKIPPKIQKKFKQRRDEFLKMPFHPILNNHPLSGERKGQWSINITGDWRAIYIRHDENTIVFLDIDTHSNLYQ